MTVGVVVPFRGTDAYREAALAWVWQRWDEIGWDVQLGYHDAGPWTKALAVADALDRTDAEVLVIADADVWSDGVVAAVHAVQAGAPWAVPHTKVYRLTPEATAHLYATGDFDGRCERGCPYTGVIGGGMTVLRRDVYEDCPLDARFAGWGGEDHAWGDALTVLYGFPARMDDPMLHLWHPPQERLNRRDPANPASAELRFRYRSARSRWEARHPSGIEQMRALVAEARHLTCGTDAA